MVSVKMLFLLLLTTHADPQIKELRLLYQQAPLDKNKATELITKLNQKETTMAVWKGYKGAASMLMAKHVSSPYRKLTYFNNGKSLLEKAIKEEQNNIELRYLRYSIQ